MNAFGVASYGAASLAFLVLTVLLATSWRGRAHGVRLIAAAAMTAVWACGLAWQAWSQPLSPVVIHTLETLRSGAWLVVLISLAQGLIPRFLAVGSQLLWAGLLAAGWVLAMLQSWVVIDTGPGKSVV